MKYAVKRAWNGSALIVALISVLALPSCKKDASITPDNNQVTIVTPNTSETTTSNTNYKLSQPVSLNGAHDITISGDSISGGAVSCINLVNCYNIRITHCKLVNSAFNGINLSGCTNIVVDSCYVANVSTGIYSFNGRSIQVKNNQIKNVQGPLAGGTLVHFENFSNDAKDAASNSATNNEKLSN